MQIFEIYIISNFVSLEWLFSNLVAGGTPRIPSSNNLKNHAQLCSICILVVCKGPRVVPLI
jgi:hypothetical protein